MLTTAVPDGARSEPLARNQSDAFHRTYDELRYSRPTPNSKRLASKIDQNDADLSTIIGVDRPRTIEDGHSVMQGQSRTRTDLRLKTLGQFNGQPGRNQRRNRRGLGQPRRRRAMRPRGPSRRHLHSYTSAIARPRHEPNACKQSQSSVFRQFDRETAHNSVCDLRLAHCWPRLNSVRVDDLNLIHFAAKGRRASRHAIGHDQITALTSQFGFRIGRHILRFRGEANHDGRP